MKKQAAWAEPLAYSESLGPPIAHFEITKIVRVTEPVYAGAGGGTLGTQLDHFLMLSAQNGDEVQSVELQVDPEWWASFRAEVTR